MIYVSFPRNATWEIQLGNDNYKFWNTSLKLIWLDAKSDTSSQTVSYLLRHVNNRTTFLSKYPQ